MVKNQQYSSAGVILTARGAVARFCGGSQDASIVLRGRGSPSSCRSPLKYGFKRRAAVLKVLLQQLGQASTVVDMMAEDWEAQGKGGRAEAKMGEQAVAEKPNAQATSIAAN